MNLFKGILLFSVLSVNLYALDTVVVRQKRLAIGINASPELCYRSATPNRTEASMLAFSAGANLRWRMDNFTASIGLQFSQKGWKSSEQKSQRGQNPANYEVRHQYNYLEMPIGGYFTICEHPKVRPVLYAGLTPAYLMYERRIKTFGDGHKEKTLFNYIHNPLNLFVNLGIGAEIDLNDKSSLQILPQASYGLLETIYYSRTGAEYLYSFGLKMCWNFRS